jgi:hypothetical protein
MWLGLHGLIKFSPSSFFSILHLIMYQKNYNKWELGVRTIYGLGY